MTLDISKMKQEVIKMDKSDKQHLEEYTRELAALNYRTKVVEGMIKKLKEYPDAD